LRSSSQTSFGHLIWQRTGAISSIASQTAIGTARGRRRWRSESGRRIAEYSSALPAGAFHERPRRPRPAVCSSVVTTVPPGAPASASSRARSLVESVSR
jgi:hypothetical protein